MEVENEMFTEELLKNSIIWLFFTFTGVLVTMAVMRVKGKIGRSTVAWVISIFSGAFGILLLISGGYIESKHSAAEGIYFAIAGVIGMSFSGIMATVATKWQSEDKRPSS